MTRRWSDLDEERRWRLAAVGAAFLVVATLRLAELASTHPRTFFDTTTYRAQSRHPLWSYSIWAGPKPPVMPILLKAVAHSNRAFVILATAVAVLAWLVLAVQVTRLLTQRAACVIALVGLVLIALSPPLNIWDSTVLTDSLSVSLGLLLLSGILAMVGRPWSWWRAGVVVLVGTVWGLTRDTNAQLLLVLAVAIALVVAVRQLSKPWLVVALGLLAVFGVAQWSQEQAKRWELPFDDVVAIRVLPDATQRNFFARHGMPVTATLLARQGLNASSGNFAFANDPRLASYRRWRDARGRATYLAWALAHPASTIKNSLVDVPAITTQDRSDYVPAGYHPTLRDGLANLVPHTRLGAAVSFLVAVVLASLAVARRRTTPLVIVGLVLLALAVPHALLVWNGGGFEFVRHGLGLDMQFRLAVLFIVAGAFDGLWPARRAAG